MRGLAIFLLALAAAPEPRYFEYQRQVVMPADRGGQTCLILDAMLFARAAAGLADLRLYHDSTEIPYALHLSAPLQPQEQSIGLLNLGARAGEISFDAIMPAGSYGDVQLVTNAEDFIATVRVGGSRTRGAPETNLGTFTIFDFTKQKLGRSTVLHLPRSDFQYLHFQIAGMDEHGSITALNVQSLPQWQPAYTAVAELNDSKVRGQSSVFEGTIAAHVPVDRVVVTPPDTSFNFSRNVSVTEAPVVQKRADGALETPQPVTATGTLLRLHRMAEGRRIDEERMTVNAPAWSFDGSAKWTVAVENGDDVPLQPRSVALQMIERKLCFEAEANAHYTLEYGDGALSAPRYDYGALFTMDAQPAIATLGPEQRNPEYQARPDQRAFTERHSELLWMVLVAVVTLLGGITLQSLRRATPTAGSE